jgi:hypothetical protein
MSAHASSTSPIFSKLTGAPGPAPMLLLPLLLPLLVQLPLLLRLR